MDHFTCALLGLIHFPPKTSHLGDPMHIFTFLCIRDDQFSKNLNFTTEGALKSKKLRKETMLEIEKYIKKHVGRKVLLTLTFSPSPTIRVLQEQFCIPKVCPTCPVGINQEKFTLNTWVE